MVPLKHGSQICLRSAQKDDVDLRIEIRYDATAVLCAASNSPGQRFTVEKQETQRAGPKGIRKRYNVFYGDLIRFKGSNDRYLGCNSGEGSQISACNLNQADVCTWFRVHEDAMEIANARSKVCYKHNIWLEPCRGGNGMNAFLECGDGDSIRLGTSEGGNWKQAFCVLKSADVEESPDVMEVVPPIEASGGGVRFVPPCLVKAIEEEKVDVVRSYLDDPPESYRNRCGSHILKNAPKDGILRDDKKVVLGAVEDQGAAYQYASEGLRGYEEDRLADAREILLRAIARKPSQSGPLEHASETLRSEKELVLAAVRTDARALKFAADSLKNDPEVVRAAVSQKKRKETFKFASDDLKKNKSFLCELLNDDRYDIFRWCDARDDEDVAKAAMKLNGLNLEFASGRLQNVSDVVLAAVKKNGAAQKFASVAMRNSPELKSLLQKKQVRENKKRKTSDGEPGGEEAKPTDDAANAAVGDDEGDAPELSNEPETTELVHGETSYEQALKAQDIDEKLELVRKMFEDDLGRIAIGGNCPRQ